MSDDEDVIFQSSPFAEYLNQAKIVNDNFDYEPDLKENTPQSTKQNMRFYDIMNFIKTLPSKISRYFSNKYFMENSFLNNQIEILLNSGLLLDEDREFLINLKHESIEIDENGKYYKISFCICLLIFLMPFIYSSKITLTMSLSSSLFLIQQAWFLKDNYFKTKRLEQLTDHLKQLFGLLKKSLNLIQENEIIMKGFTLVSVGTTANRIENSNFPLSKQMMPAFRSSLLCTTENIVQILSRGTFSLFQDFPLSLHVDNMEHYICNIQIDEIFTLNEMIKTADIKKCYNIGLLIVSEYLKRLAMCYYPILWNTTHPHESVFKIYQNINTIDQNVLKLTKNINTQYKIYNCYGMSINESIQNPMQNIRIKNSEVFISIHSAKLHLQKLLFTLTEIEEDILKNSDHDSEIYLEKMETYFEQINSFIAICKDSLDYGSSYIANQKIKTKQSIPLVNAEDLIKEPKEDDIKNINTIPQEEDREDQIFEAVCDKNCNPTEDDDEDELIPSLNYKSTKEDCSTLLKELKRVLISKAKEHIEREEIAYNKRYLKKNSCENISETLNLRLNLKNPSEIEGEKPKKCKIKTYDEEEMDFEKSNNSIRFRLPAFKPDFNKLQNKPSVECEFFSNEEND